jgi:hypothetical protein
MNKGLDPLEANMPLVVEYPDAEERAAFDFAERGPGWYASPPEFAMAGSMDDEPVLFKEAMAGSDTSEWKAVWDKEISRLEAAHTWKLVDPPTDVPIIPCGNMLKTKRVPDNEVVEHHFRIVAGGHKQQKGVDYKESFSSVGFCTGNPRVGFSHTVPEPVYTVPATGTGTHRPVKFAVCRETRGTFGTRGF